MANDLPVALVTAAAGAGIGAAVVRRACFGRLRRRGDRRPRAPVPPVRRSPVRRARAGDPSPTTST